MIGIEETIWATTFSDALRRYGHGIAREKAYEAVMRFRDQNADFTLSAVAVEALAMYNEVKGIVESERVRIQKKMLRSVLDFCRSEARISATCMTENMSSLDSLKHEATMKAWQQLEQLIDKTLNA